MAGIRQACPGCGALIEILRVNPGEDDTVAWRVTWQAAPYGHSAPMADADKVFINCPKGIVFAVPLPKRESESDLDLTPEVIERAMRKAGMLPEKSLDTVQCETWLEYHDRLVREYFDGERGLLKEVYPDRPELRHRPKAPSIAKRRMEGATDIVMAWMPTVLLALFVTACILGLTWLLKAVF